jgi:hypothetical protein
MPALCHHPAAIRLQTLRSTQGSTLRPHFQVVLEALPLVLSPFSARLRRGPDAVPSEATPAGRPASRSFGQRAKERDERSSTKKKTMKTTTQKNQTNGLLSRSERLGLESRPEIDFDLRRANRALETEKLLALLRSDAPRFFEIAEVVGKWVWIQFSDKQPPTITSVLAELGFHWNNARQAWQHPCGTIRKERATFDPRKRYRSYFAADAKPI